MRMKLVQAENYSPGLLKSPLSLFSHSPWKRRLLLLSVRPGAFKDVLVETVLGKLGLG